ncbi:MAG TPA: PEP-CTERM sorting domain-containing protein [Verrucomicrobiae bacterium]|nr:PEP-CTERM sorting domain-containing protein [Verrucomicrobiae bacterium]
MKLSVLLVSIVLLSRTLLAQGTVNFFNSDSTLISAGAPGQGVPITSPAGSYFFGLLLAPPGTTDPSHFSFTGIYATNVGGAFPGRISGGTDVRVPGWIEFGTMSFFVAGWSASLGHDWQQTWINGAFGTSGFFGQSAIATGMASGPTTPPNPPYNLFGGGTGIQTGFDLLPVPEPSVWALVVAGGAMLLARHCRQRWTGLNRR